VLATDGRCVFASGSPQDPLDFKGGLREFSQANNLYLFPGAVGVGVGCGVGCAFLWTDCLCRAWLCVVVRLYVCADRGRLAFALRRRHGTGRVSGAHRHRVECHVHGGC